MKIAASGEHANKKKDTVNNGSVPLNSPKESGNLFGGLQELHNNPFLIWLKPARHEKDHQIDQNDQYLNGKGVG